VPEPLVFGFDDVVAGPAGTFSVRPAPANFGRPVWTYWFPLLCLLSRGTMSAVPARLAAARSAFVYPVELRWEATEWCAQAPPGEPLAVLPAEVTAALARRRALVVFSIAHEGRALWEPSMPPGAGLLDRLAEFARQHGLAPEQLWLVSGNLDGDREVRVWRESRALAALPFTFRACEPFSAFVGACTRESMRYGRAPSALTTCVRVNPERLDWHATTVGWTARPFPGASAGQEPPRYAYACLNRAFRAHRWAVLNRLWQEGMLDRGLVSFPRPSKDDLADQGLDPTTELASGLMARLPLEVDRTARFDDAAYFGDNSAFVGLHPAAVLRDAAMEIVTETALSGPLFVSEKIFKALLGRGPAAMVAPRGAVDYLRRLGVRTWDGLVDEAYDEIVDPRERLGAAIFSALDWVRTQGTATPAVAQREANLRWLVQATKPWDALMGELSDTLRAL
jgi:hypothetical protein